MGSRSTKWLSGIGAVLIVGGLVLANAGSWGTPAAAAVPAGNGTMQCNREGTSCWPVQNYGNGTNPGNPPPQGNPFTKILEKLDEILAAITGGGGQDGNHTLRWDQVLPAAQRFVVLAVFNNQAVLDKETGLVWEQSPSTENTAHWGVATNVCIKKAVGGRKGWRLPSIPELASLIDPLVASPGPTLPPGHPFANVASVPYISATTSSMPDEPPSLAWGVNFNDGNITFVLLSANYRAWCVRGGMNADRYGSIS